MTKAQTPKQRTAAKRRRQAKADRATLRIDDELRRKGIWISPTLRQDPPA